MKIETVVPLPPEDSGLQHCIARFHNRNMDSKRKDKTRFFRREPVMIVNPETKAKVLRYAMGNLEFIHHKAGGRAGLRCGRCSGCSF